MLFNSWLFLPFLLTVLALYYSLRLRGQNFMLLIASYVFYAAWDWRFLSLIWLSTAVDFVVGRQLHRQTASPRARSALLLLSCAVNLGLLGVFKYFNFFMDSAADLLSWLGLPWSTSGLNIVLPVGISFYTFQTMSYTIDIYRGRLTPCKSVFDFALFVAYFPQLVAGPIERAARLLPQITSQRKVDTDQLFQGAWLVLWGLFKKVVIADNLAIVVDRVFETGGDTNGVECLLAIYAFAYQIYCDFSGYSDIARGVAKLMGIDLMLNFERPYLAQNPSEFWHRWHISLSTWLRDYLYIPLGGSRLGKFKTYRNLLLTMVLGGLWHGAAWNFVLWGAFHGVLLAIHRWFFTNRNVNEASERTGLFAALRRVGMFHLVCFGWLLFRAPDLHVVWTFMTAMATDFRLSANAIVAACTVTILASTLWVFELWLKTVDDPRTRPGWQRGLGPLAISALLMALWLFAPPVSGEFIYFQF